MSDFSLGKIANFLEKDSRTLRRWCEAGIVPADIAFRSQGGHWRIRGESVQAVVESLQKRIPKTSRRRKENAYPVGLGVKNWRHGLTPRQAWMQLPSGFDSRSRVFHITPWAIRGNRDSASACQRFLDHVADGWLDMSQELTEWFHDQPGVNAAQKMPGPLTAECLAQQAGVSLRTFYRKFPRWKSSVIKLVVGKLRMKLHDERGDVVAADYFDHDEIDRRNGWRDTA